MGTCRSSTSPFVKDLLLDSKICIKWEGGLLSVINTLFYCLRLVIAFKTGRKWSINSNQLYVSFGVFFLLSFFLMIFPLLAFPPTFPLFPLIIASSSLSFLCEQSRSISSNASGLILHSYSFNLCNFCSNYTLYITLRSTRACMSMYWLYLRWHY